jgi:hypothetical protein
VLFIFLFFFRVEASSGITVTAARFSPVHLFIFFSFQSGEEVCCIVFLIVGRSISSPGERQIWCGAENMAAHCGKFLSVQLEKCEWFNSPVQPFISLIEQSNLDDSMNLFTR